MADHLFKIGAQVSLATTWQATPSSTYIVEAQMPPVGDFFQYRIKSETEGFRRVVVEHQLSPFDATALPVASSATSVHPGEEN